MKKQLLGGLAATGLALGLAAGTASAYTPTFVGKGEVQEAFGWNNHTMQANHTAVGFVYESTTVYTFECEWWTGPARNRTYHSNTKTVTTGVDEAVASLSRKTGQWTGWSIVLPEASAAVEPTDADCGSEGNGMKSIVDGSVRAASGGGGLYAVYGEHRHLLTPSS